jgi:hypothetical protein
MSAIVYFFLLFQVKSEAITFLSRQETTRSFQEYSIVSWTLTTEVAQPRIFMAACFCLEGHSPAEGTACTMNEVAQQATVERSKAKDLLQAFSAP